MATTETVHFESVLDSWEKKWRNQTLTVYALDTSSQTFAPNTTQSSSAMMNYVASPNLYTPAILTIPSTAVATFNSTNRRAEYPPQNWTITCTPNQTVGLYFSQFMVTIGTGPNQKVHFISAQIEPPIALAPGASYVGTIQLGTQ